MRGELLRVCEVRYGTVRCGGTAVRGVCLRVFFLAKHFFHQHKPILTRGVRKAFLHNIAGKLVLAQRQQTPLLWQTELSAAVQRLSVRASPVAARLHPCANHCHAQGRAGSRSSRTGFCTTLEHSPTLQPGSPPAPHTSADAELTSRTGNRPAVRVHSAPATAE